MCSDDTCTAAVCFPLQAWCRTQNVRDETKPTWKPLRGNLLSSPATAMQTFLSDRSEVFPFFFFFFPFFFWFIGIEKKSSYDRWAFLVYLLKFLHFCAYVPNPQNESGKMLSEWTEWGSSFTSELSRLNNEGLRQPHGTQHQPLKLQHLPGSQRSDPWQFKCNVLQLWGVLDLCVTCPY